MKCFCVKFHSRWFSVPSQKQLVAPIEPILPQVPPLKSRCNRPFAMNTEELINILTYYHLQEFSSGRELIQNLQEDEYARNLIAPAGGLKRSTFFDTVNDRGVEQLLYVFTELQKNTSAALPSQHAELGELVAIDGSLIDSVLSRHWAEYRTNSKKAKLHLGFNLNNGIPRKLFLTEGNGAERPFVSRIIDPAQTAVLDRGYHKPTTFLISGRRMIATLSAVSRVILIKRCCAHILYPKIPMSSLMPPSNSVRLVSTKPKSR